MPDEKILIVDDDSDIRNLLEIYLAKEGYRCIQCDNALKALEIIEKESVILILLDVMMPKLDGVSACVRFREKTNVPIIILSAKAEENDIVNGLTAGGDDYVTKPFQPVQLMTRVKAQLRRFRQYNAYNAHDDNPRVLRYDDLALHTAERRVWVGGSEIQLTLKEYDILALLLKNRGSVLSMKEIYEAVWHEEFIGAENTVMMHIANLRRKLGVDKNSPTYIKTRSGVHLQGASVISGVKSV